MTLIVQIYDNLVTVQPHLLMLDEDCAAILRKVAPKKKSEFVRKAIMATIRRDGEDEPAPKPQETPKKRVHVVNLH